MAYTYKLEQDPTREAEHVPCCRQSPLAAWQIGRSGDETPTSSGRKEDANWDLHLMCEHPCPCHQDPFLRNQLFVSLPYFQVLPYCLFLPVFSSEWHETLCVNHNTVVVWPLLFSFQQEELKNVYSEVICKYFSWLFRFNCQIKKKYICRQCHF